jgi:prepilin-type N-terminal cleavage/methylation domain-containing protein
MKRSGKKGFTLIELIIVIAILAILAVIIIPKIVNTKGAAQVGVNRTNAKQIQSALAQYYAENDKYPAQGSTTATVGGVEGVISTIQGKVPKYKNGTSMIKTYTLSGSPASYSIVFNDDTGTPGNEDTQSTSNPLKDDTDTNSLFK